MKYLIALMLSFTCAVSHAATDEETRWAYKFVLVTATDFHDVSPILTGLETDDEFLTVEMLDLMAELLATRTAMDHDEEIARGQVAATLVDAKNPRYFSLLQRIGGEWLDSKAKRVARKAVIRKTPPDVEQYEAGMVNVKALRDEYSRAALVAMPTDAAAVNLSQVEGGVTLAQVLKHAGKPQGVSTRFRRRIPGINVPFNRTYSRLALYYRGLGRVELQYRNGQGWLVRSVAVAPLAFEDFMPYRQDPSIYGQPDDNFLALTQLVSNDPGAIRLMLDASEQYDQASLELLDTAAERLLQEHALADRPLESDLYNWMCVLLTHEGGDRYANVLATVAGSTTDEKTRVFATEKIDSKKYPGAPPYVPGTISLDAQRAKYPSLYPQRTFYSGRL